MAKKITDETKRQLKTVVDYFGNEDREVRDRQIRTWRKLKLLWENLQHTYYSEVAHDWRIPEAERYGGDDDQAYYDKPVNVYRAYLESIIAALSITVPPVSCYPDDADNALDQSTAKAGDKIAELIFKHNDAPLLWLHALFIYMTEGMTACYTYPEYDEKYGTYEEKHHREDVEVHEYQICPICQFEMGDRIISNTQRNKFAPGEEDAFVNDFLFNEGMDICESCGRTVIPELQQSNLIVTRWVGTTHKPKARICMEAYGGLFVKVPIWARTQKDCTYLIYAYETHYANAIEEYPDIRGKIERNKSTPTGVMDTYEQLGRLSPQYRGEYPMDNVTIRECWLRPAAFNILEDEQADDLKKQFPNGVKVCLVNECVAEACNESLDDRWTITYNPLSDYIHFDPMGLLLTSVQEITNDLISLTVQTIEHGIPQTFADPKVVNFKAYRQNESVPGAIYPINKGSTGGRALGEFFHEVKTATLSAEILPVFQKFQELGQLVSGALPSLFGGQLEGSRTASEYSMSRAQALQRQQNTWKTLLSWWKNIFGKVIPQYIKEVREDERFVKKDTNGNFVNVFIRKAELEGKIGSVELEANENLPLTWSQQKDVIMQLLESNNEMIISTLGSPENLPYIKRAIGLTEYIIPGEADRQKQYDEIQKLIDSEPIEMPPDPMMQMEAELNGMPPMEPEMIPSVEVDFDLDNHQIEGGLCREWLISEAGRLCKIENPPGYQNVLLHYKMHKQAEMEQMMQSMPPPPPSGKDGEKAPKGKEQQAPPNTPPVNEAANVSSVQ